MSALKIQELKEKLHQLSGATTKEFHPSRGIPLGIPKGSIVELSGALRTEWVIRFLKENESLEVFWLEREQTVLPTGIQQRGVSLDRVTFAVCAEPYKILRQTLQSGYFGVVIAPSIFEEDRLLKGLQLLTEKAGAVLFLSTLKLKSAWPISVQLEISKQLECGDLEIDIVKHKYAGIS